MAKRLGPVAKLLAIYDGMSDTEREIAFDLLRSKQPKKTAAKKSTARGAGRRSSPKKDAVIKSTPSSETNKDAATPAGSDGSEDVS